MRLFITILFFLCLWLSACVPDELNPPDTEIPELDFNVHFDGRFYLPEGWKSTLWAESPMLFNPTNIDVDARGRVWVAEAVNYRDYNNPPGNFPHNTRGDRILILEDTDQDGVADSSKVFVQDADLVAPLGVAVIGKQVVVSSSPNLIVYTDTDGDDRPDNKEILLSGFGGYDHDHSLHAVVAGPDGKWYFNTGNAGPHTVTDRSGWTLRSGSIYTGGSPYNTQNEGMRRSDDGKVWVGGLALRMRPDGTGLEVLAHNFRNAYELAVDSYGDLWQNDNDDQVETCRATWIMPRGNAGYFSADGTRFWQADRRPGQSMFAAHWHQDDPGVMPAGDNTGAGSPTGVLVYEGDAFGPMYRGMFLSVDAGRNVVFAYQPRPYGAGFRLERKELISSIGESTEGYIWNQQTTDERKWFRPSDIAVGPDGALYIADWYDPVVGGHQMRDSAAYGRIYRIAPAEKELRSPSLDLNTLKGAVEAFLNPAPHVRYLGFEALREYGEDALPAVDSLLEGQNPFHRARAVWLLAQLGEKGKDRVSGVLRTAPDPRLRVAAFRALTSQNPDELSSLAAAYADDPSPQVRREIATAIYRLPDEEAFPILKKLFAAFEGRDRWYLEALGTALEGREPEFFQELLPAQPQNAVAWDSAFARLAWRLHPPGAVPGFRVRALDSSLTLPQRLESLTAIAFVPEAQAASTMREIAGQAADPRIRNMASWWLGFRAGNSWYEFVDKEALESLSGDAAPDKEAGGMQKVPAGKMENPDEGPNLEEVLALQADPARGAELFRRSCGTCHQIDGEGIDIGPRLKHIRTKFDRRALSDAILHPDDGITFGYEPVMISRKDGDAVIGFLVSDGPTVVVTDLSGKRHIIPREQVSGREVMDYSLMPRPSALGLDAQGVADVVGYLLSLR